MKDHIHENVIIAATNKVTAGGAVTSVVSGLTLNDWGVIIGIAIGGVGLVANVALNFWFKHQHLKILRDQLGKDDERRR